MLMTDTRIPRGVAIHNYRMTKALDLNNGTCRAGIIRGCVPPTVPCPGPLAYYTDHIEPRRNATSTQPSSDLRRYFREAH